MTDLVQILAVLVSLGLLGLVLELVRRKRLTEEYSFVWIICGLALLAASLGRSVLDHVALAIGIHYPPALLLLVLVFFVFVASLSFSVHVSRQRQQIERLIEDAAILDAQLRELHARLDGDAAAPGAAGRRVLTARAAEHAAPRVGAQRAASDPFTPAVPTPK